MKKAKKTRTLIPIFIALFAVILVSAIMLFIHSLSGNYINYVNVDNKAETVSDITAQDSNVIIFNGIVLGATKNNQWISAERFYDVNDKSGEIEVNLYSQNSQYGTFKTASFRNSQGLIYTTIAKDTLPDQYLAVSSKIQSGIVSMKKQEATKQDENYVKEALGGYKLLNGGVNIVEVYTTNIKENGDKIICATAKKANILGVYSAVVYVTKGKATLVKYSYVRDTDNSDRWPVYSLKAVHNLDGKDTPELILEEVTGNDVRYTVLEYRNDNNFYQVLSTSIAL